MTDAYTAGLKVRRQVMGDDFVDRAFANASEFTRPLQDFITANAWGSVWCRDGLDLKTRSLVTVAMLTALGRQTELRGHLRGALNNGASAAEIQEILLHATVYCGVPLAADAFRTAEAVIADYLAEGGLPREGGAASSQGQNPSA
jgi:4-carboxymuconolactone decarboxylase